MGILKKKNLVNEEYSIKLKQLAGKHSEFLSRYLKKNAAKNVPQKYGDELKKFAVKLLFVPKSL